MRFYDWKFLRTVLRLRIKYCDGVLCESQLVMVIPSTMEKSRYFVNLFSLVYISPVSSVIIVNSQIEMRLRYSF